VAILFDMSLVLVVSSRGILDRQAIGQVMMLVCHIQSVSKDICVAELSRMSRTHLFIYLPWRLYISTQEKYNIRNKTLINTKFFNKAVNFTRTEVRQIHLTVFVISVW